MTIRGVFAFYRGTSRGAKLPVVPGTQPQPQGVSGFFGSITGRRKLPDRGTAQSRSLDYPSGHPTLETVVEAGRGVRKLPAQPGSTTMRPRAGASSLWKGAMQTPMVNVQGPTPVNNGFGPNQPVNNGFGPNQPVNNGFGPNPPVNTAFGPNPPVNNGFGPNQGPDAGFGPMQSANTNMGPNQGPNTGFGPTPGPDTNFGPNQGGPNGFVPNQGPNTNLGPNNGFGPNQPMNNGFGPNQPMNNGFGPPQPQTQPQMNNGFIPNNGYVANDDLQLRPPEWT